MLTESGQWSSSIRQVTDVSGAVVLQIAITSFFNTCMGYFFSLTMVKVMDRKRSPALLLWRGPQSYTVSPKWSERGQSCFTHLAKGRTHAASRTCAVVTTNPGSKFGTYSKHSRCLAHCHWVYWFYGFTDDRNKYSVASWMKELFENIYIRQLRQAGYV